MQPHVWEDGMYNLAPIGGLHQPIKTTGNSVVMYDQASRMNKARQNTMAIYLSRNEIALHPSVIDS
jgi:hypothetical protein